jgi:site-specific recombinase XerD
MRCGDSTLTHYRYWAGRFVEWLACRRVTEAPAIAAAHVREWLAEDADRLMATSLHARARGVRTLVRFLHAEGYAPTLITFKMPRLEKKRLPCLDAEGVRRVLAAWDAARERALVLTLVDSGVGREECSLLDWGDVSFKTEALVVRRGKGGKARLAVVGAKTLRAILACRRALPEPPADDSPLFRDRCGRLFTGVHRSHARAHQPSLGYSLLGSRPTADVRASLASRRVRHRESATPHGPRRRCHDLALPPND